MSGCLHHLGVKKAVVASEDQGDIPVADAQVIAVAAFRDEVSDDTWALIARAPVKHIMRLLSQDAGEIALLSPPWGRSFHRAGKKSDPVTATTVQIHIRVAKSELHRILRASGSCGVYCTPKTEAKKVMSEYLVVWLNQAPVDFAVSLSKVDYHCGVIRGSKGEITNKGIRFEKSDFLKGFAILKPDDKLPTMIIANHHFKIAPTPLGSTMEQVQQWLNAQSWEARPVKPLSGDCWLCVAEKRFDMIFAQWNSNPVLIKWIDEKKNRSPVVLAGEVHKSVGLKAQEMSKQVTTSSNQNANVDDPWGAWIANKGSTGLQTSGLPSRSSIFSATMAQPPRKPDSPIEDRFNRHDGALRELKQHTDQELEQLRESIARIEHNMEIQNTNMQANMEMTNAEFRTLRSETSNQLQALTGAFAESLKTAIASQESQLSVQFAELKEMIKTRSGGSSGVSPPQKKSKKGEEDSSL